MGAIAQIVYGVKHSAPITNFVCVFQSVAKDGKVFASTIGRKPAHSAEAGRSVNAHFFVNGLKLHDCLRCCYNTLRNKNA